MRDELFLKRVKEKANAPDLFTSDRCMIWTGGSIPAHNLRRKQYGKIVTGKVKATSRIIFRGQQTSVQRALHTDALATATDKVRNGLIIAPQRHEIARMCSKGADGRHIEWSIDDAKVVA